MTVEAEGGIFLVQPRILNTISHVSMLHLRPYIYIYIYIYIIYEPLKGLPLTIRHLMTFSDAVSRV
jgi:hypothetical protein